MKAKQVWTENETPKNWDKTVITDSLYYWLETFYRIILNSLSGGFNQVWNYSSQSIRFILPDFD